MNILDYKEDGLWLMQGDCLERMKEIPDDSVNLILTDPPYGTTACKWDYVIPFDAMWCRVKNIRKTRSAIVIFGQEPFSSALRLSNVSEFKYDWYWRKSRPSGFVNAKLKPLKDIEVISVFSDGNTANGSVNMLYYPQGLEETNLKWNRPKNYDGQEGINFGRKNNKLDRVIKNTGYPRQVLDFKNSNSGMLHPTQKPIDLLEYLIKTYTKEGDTVLDFTMGSGSTGVACRNLNRKFIGIELDENYFNIAKERILSS